MDTGTPLFGTESFQRFADDIGGIFWLVDWKEREVLYVSPSWERVWGQSVECLYSDHKRAWADNIHPDDRERVLADFSAYAETGEYDVDFRVVHPDGSVRWLHERCFPIVDDAGTIVRLAGVAEDITGRKRVEEELLAVNQATDARRRNEVAALTSELLYAEENERRRLAEELHDGMSQVITLALLKLAQLKDTTEGRAAELACEIEDLVDEAGRACRSLTHRLSPPILHDLGFVPALEWLVEEIHTAHGLDVELSIQDGEALLEDRVKILLFRAVRDLLANVATHAGAHKATVRLSAQGASLCVDVSDDGTALRPDASAIRRAGLQGIRERLSNLGGKMRIESTPGTGTCITLVAPVRGHDMLTP